MGKADQVDGMDERTGTDGPLRLGEGCRRLGRWRWERFVKRLSTNSAMSVMFDNLGGITKQTASDKRRRACAKFAKSCRGAG